MEFIKHPEWKIHSKAKDNSVKLYTRVSDRQLFCLKSVAYVREHIKDVYLALCDFGLKQKYDETFDCGHTVHEYMPYDTSCSYLRFKKVLVVSPRDMTVVGKQYQVSDKLIYLWAKSTNIPSIPPVKNIVRAETPISGWKIKQIEDGGNGKKPLCKLWFYSEADFKISLFIQKSAGPKSGHIADAFARYVAKNPLR